MPRTTVRPSQLAPEVATEVAVEDDIHALRGAANGIAPLNSSSQVPMVNLPAIELADFVDSRIMDGGEF